MLILGSPDCEWPLCLAIFHACSWCLFLALQRVSGHFALQYFVPAHLFLALQFVSGYFSLQYFMPAHDAYSWLSSQWVATLPYNISCLLMMLVLDSPASEWLLCLAIFHVYSWCLFLALQPVSGYLPCNISCLLIMLAHGSPESEWLLCLAIFHACSWCLFLALQRVSGYFTLQYFMPAHWCLFLALQFVSGTLPYNISCLLMMLVLGSPAGEWLLCLAMFSACSWCLFLAL